MSKKLPKIQFQSLVASAKIPEKATEGSAGYDLYASEDEILHPGEIKAIALGFAAALPDGIHGRIESRSGNALKGYVVMTGVIDTDYRGEWKVIACNFSNMPWFIKAGDRVAQLVLRPTVEASVEAVEGVLDATERGAGGFGSTGTR